MRRIPRKRARKRRVKKRVEMVVLRRSSRRPSILYVCANRNGPRERRGSVGQFSLHRVGPRHTRATTDTEPSGTSLSRPRCPKRFRCQGIGEEIVCLGGPSGRVNVQMATSRFVEAKRAWRAFGYGSYRESPRFGIVNTGPCR